MVAAYLSSASQIGNREYLIDYITRVSPEETVFMTMAPKGTTESQKHEWLNETLAASDPTNAVAEGASVSYAASDFSARTRSFNYCQIPRRKVSVSYSQDAINKPQIGKGPESEFKHQRMLKTIELSKDMDAILLSANTKTQPNADTPTAGKIDGIQTMITTNTVPAAGAILSQDIYNQLAQKVWDATRKKTDTCLVGGFNKRQISNWTTRTNRNIDASGKKLIEVVDNYQSDFGTQNILLEGELTASVALLLNMKYWKVVFLRPVFWEQTGLTGGKSEGYVESEFTLEGTAENTSGMITGTATGS